MTKLPPGLSATDDFVAAALGADER